MTSRERVERRLVAILAADVAGYSRMMGEDEEGTLAGLKAIRRELAEPKTAEHRRNSRIPPQRRWPARNHDNRPAQSRTSKCASVGNIDRPLTGSMSCGQAEKATMQFISA